MPESRWVLMRCWVSADSTGTASPQRSALSAATELTPPPSERIATRFPLGFGQSSNVSARSNISSMFATRRIPACSKAASTMRSSAASAPVWDALARRPAVVRPTFMAMIGLVRVAFRQAR